MNGITGEQIYTAALVFLAACGAVTTIGKAIEVIRNWRKPAGSLQHKVAKHEEQLAVLKEGQRVTCEALMALLGHELHNGNSDEMQEASRKLNQYLVNR